MMAMINGSSTVTTTMTLTAVAGKYISYVSNTSRGQSLICPCLSYWVLYVRSIEDRFIVFHVSVLLMCASDVRLCFQKGDLKINWWIYTDKICLKCCLQIGSLRMHLYIIVLSMVLWITHSSSHSCLTSWGQAQLGQRDVVYFITS